MKNINTTETTAVVCFNFGSCARVGVTLYEGLTVDECVALRSEDIEEYKIEGGEWTTRKATADEARQHLEAIRNEEETETTESTEGGIASKTVYFTPSDIGRDLTREDLRAADAIGCGLLEQVLPDLISFHDIQPAELPIVLRFLAERFGLRSVEVCDCVTCGCRAEEGEPIAVEIPTTAEATGEETAPDFTITKNDQFNSVEVSFSGKPSAEVRDALKALRFRWHGVKRVWYGYATEDAVRAAIEGQSGEKTTNSTETAPKASKATKATQKAQGTAQDHIRIYWNGIKVDGGKLIRCGYSIDNNAENTPSVSIYARDYDHLPRDLFEVRNESDSYTDYFENDSTYLTPEHPLYKYFRFVAMKAKARDDSKYCEYLRDTLNSGKREPWAGHYDSLRADLARREQFLAEFDKMTDPGQPTAEDLEQIDRQRQEAENARKAAEHEEELRQREAYLCQRVHGQRLIRAEQEAHPINADQPIVTIMWSEHPAFSDYEDGELLLSVTAAENILHTLDKEQHETRDTDQGRGWYYKTKFTISGVDFEGEPLEYEGRYDLGDGDGGLIQHIRSFGEWNRTHGPFGQPIENPEENNGTIRFADYLAGIIESEEEREECEEEKGTKTAGYIACYKAIEAALLEAPEVYQAFTQYFDTDKLSEIRDTFGFDLYSECMHDAQKALSV